MNRNNITTFFFILLSVLGLTKGEKTPMVLPTEVKIKVKGVVCSFCAYGVEKNLSKLEFVDKKKFSSKGILVDISKQMVSIAIEHGKKVNLQSILEAIKKGGYEVVRFYLNISGIVTQSKEKYILINSENKQLFELQGKNLASLKNKKELKFTVSIIANKVSSLGKGQPTPADILEVKENK
jgi:copper chaperone CopZ